MYIRMRTISHDMLVISNLQVSLKTTFKNSLLHITPGPMSSCADHYRVIGPCMYGFNTESFSVN